MGTDVEEALAELRGRFHSHLTVRAATADLPRLRAVARDCQAKVTVIELAGLDDRVERDVMLTRYHLDSAVGAVGRIASSLDGTRRTLEAAGWPVVRVKVEHESEPSLDRYDEERYHEVHIKLALPEARYEDEYAWLVQVARALGWVPSHNPYERRPGVVVQFVTLRCHEGDRAHADAVVARALAAIGERGLAVIEVKRETTVLDTRPSHDRWWSGR